MWPINYKDVSYLLSHGLYFNLAEFLNLSVIEVTQKKFGDLIRLESFELNTVDISLL